MTDPISDFIYEYFLKTMCYQYNVVNTVVYGLILAAAVFGTYKLLEKLKIKIDKKLFCAIMPFIIFGGSARALRDHTEISTIFQSVPQLFCSPIIYFVIFAIALGSLLLGIALQKKFKIGYWNQFQDRKLGCRCHDRRSFCVLDCPVFRLQPFQA
jgi:uncharacterized membrane protein